MPRSPLAILAAALLAPLPALAQPQPGDSAAARRLPHWVNVGIVGTDEQLGLGASYTRTLSAGRIVTARALLTEEFCLFGCGNRPDRTGELGVMFGIATQSRFALFSVAAGGAVVGVRRTVATGRDAPPYTRETGGLTVGVPLEAQLFLRPFRFLGIGVAGVANANTERSFSGLLVGVQVGRLTASRQSWLRS